MNWLKQLPKVELHVHLEGTIAPALLHQLAEKNRIPLPEKFSKNPQAYPFKDFSEFLTTYDEVSGFMRSAEDLYLITLDYLQRCAATGVIYVELTASYDHAKAAGLNYVEQLDAIVRAIDEAKRLYDIDARIIMVIVRHLGLENAEQVLQNILSHPHPYVVGLGLAGDEIHFPPALFKEVFAKAHAAGLKLTAHAGEWAGPEQIYSALDTLQISRIGHGVRASEDEKLMTRLRDQRIHLEVCPNSNLALKVYPSVAQHPLPKLLAAGISCSLNSDDPPFFNTSVAAEYELAHTAFDFSAKDLLQITENAIDASFADAVLKQQLRQKVRQYQLTETKS